MKHSAYVSVASYPRIIDGHNDVLLRLSEAGDQAESMFFQRGSSGHMDLPRAREGGLGAGFFAVYVPDPAETKDSVTSAAATYQSQPAAPLPVDYATHAAMAQMAVLFRLEERSCGQLKVVRTADEMEQCLRSGVLGAVLHMEGAEAIDADLAALRVFFEAGLRSLGIVWSRPNAFGHGVPFRYPSSPDTGPGLTDTGRVLVRECNRLGVLVDLSHLNERGFWDVAGLSTAPLVATHSGAHGVCATSRNLTDRQLDAIRESGGIVGMNFAVCFLRPDGLNSQDTPLDVMVRHLDYLVQRLGIDHVGLGSDFDGAVVSESLGDVAGLPRLLDALRAAGFGERDLAKLAHENWLRVLRATWSREQA